MTNNQYNSGLETTVYDTFRNIPMETKTVPTASEIEQIADSVETEIPTKTVETDKRPTYKPRSKKGLETKHLVYAGIAAAGIGIATLIGGGIYFKNEADKMRNFYKPLQTVGNLLNGKYLNNSK